MTDTEEQFDLAPKIDEPTNAFKIVHIYNKSNTYHLTRQVLLDSTLTQNTYCFFYHILAESMNEFNKSYGSFACLIARNNIEADLYLNVDSQALDYIIKYIQTGKINGEAIYAENWKTVDEIIDLAAMFGMPNLVSILRGLHPTEDKINQTIALIKQSFTMVLYVYMHYIDVNDVNDTGKYVEIFNNFVEENKQSIIDIYIKGSMYNSNTFMSKCIVLFMEMFMTPLLCKYLKDIHKPQDEYQYETGAECKFSDTCTKTCHNCNISDASTKNCNECNISDTINKICPECDVSETCCEPKYENETSIHQPVSIKNFHEMMAKYVSAGDTELVNDNNSNIQINEDMIYDDMTYNDSSNNSSTDTENLDSENIEIVIDNDSIQKLLGLKLNFTNTEPSNFGETLKNMMSRWKMPPMKNYSN
jgi:hypothetical protein